MAETHECPICGAMHDVLSDPNASGGGIHGPGGAHEAHGVVIDSRRAVLLGEITVAMVHLTRRGKPSQDAVGVLLGGKVNQPPDAPESHGEPNYVSHLYLLDWQAAAKLVTELHALAGRNDSTIVFHSHLDREWDALKQDDLVRRSE